MAGSIPSSGPDSHTRLRIAEGLDAVLISDNEVLIQFGSRSHPSRLLRDTDLTGVLGQIFWHFQNGPVTQEDLLAAIVPEHRNEAARLIDSLYGQGIIADGEKSPVDQYLAYTFTGETRLADRGVCVIGAGPLGARIAETLLQHGIGSVRLFEGRPPDAVWPRYARPGHSSTSPAQEQLRDVLRERGHPGVEAYDLDTEGALEKSIAACDITVLALEQPDIRLAHLVNRYCLGADKRWIHATIDGNVGVIGPLFAPGVTACYNDFRTLLNAAGPNPAIMSRFHRRFVADRGARSFSPGLPCHADIAGGFVALGAVHWLVSGSCYLLGRLLVIDFDRLTIDMEDVLKLPRCPVCGRRRPAAEPPFSVEAVTRGNTDRRASGETGEG